MKDHIIDNPPAMTWLFKDDNVYLELAGREHRVKSIRVCANGTKDLFLVKGKDDSFELTQRDKLLKTDEIIYHYQDDVVIMDFEKPYPFDTPFIYWEMNEESVPLIETALKLFKGVKGIDYDAFLGREYCSGQL